MADLFLGRPRSRRYRKFNIRRDIPFASLTGAFIIAVAGGCHQSDSNPTSPSPGFEAGSAVGLSSTSSSSFNAFNETDEVACARGARFYCQNQNGNNPNMSHQEFLEIHRPVQLT